MIDEWKNIKLENADYTVEQDGEIITISIINGQVIKIKSKDENNNDLIHYIEGENHENKCIETIQKSIHSTQKDGNQNKLFKIDELDKDLEL